jgi:phosphoglycerate dehydrogenase-like enzyme
MPAANKTPKVVAYGPSGTLLHEIIQAEAPGDWNLAMVDNRSASQEDLKTEVSDADFLVVFGGRITPDILRSGRNLRFVQGCSAGFEGFPVAEAGELGILFSNASGTNAQGVSEMALSLMLGLYRHLPWLDSSVREGDWVTDRSSGTATYEIEGKTIGIIGLGNIGSITARILSGFNSTLIYNDIEAKPDTEAKYGVRRVELDELLSESDIITLHTPLDDSTRGLISARELALMKPSAILINTCRGPVVDESALHDALVQRKIWGAGLDVFEEEPTPADNPILRLDNVIVAPHVAGRTTESYPRRAAFAFQNMRRILAGDKPLNLITPDQS